MKPLCPNSYTGPLIIGTYEKRAPNLKNPYPFSDIAFRQKLWQTKKFFKCISNSLISISHIGLYNPVVPSKTIPQIQTKMGKVYTGFQTKTAPKPIVTLWGCTYLYGLHKGVPRSPPRLPMGLLISIILLMSDLKATNFLQISLKKQLTESP